MKHLWFAIVLVAVAPRVSALPDTFKTSEILKTSSARELAKAVKQATSSQRRARGCEIQRREGVPPTLCYPSKNLEALDVECVRTSRKAVRIPAADEFTSRACRDAIEKRTADLAYASQSDASR